MGSDFQIFFFDGRSLVQQLAERTLSTREAYFYLIYEYLLITLYNMIGKIHESASTSDTQSRFIGVVIGVAIFLPIAFAVFNMIYKANGGDQGKDFLGRLLALNFVALCRVSVFLLPLYLFMNIVGASGAFTTIAMVISLAGAVVGIASLIYCPLYVHHRLIEINQSGMTESL